MVGHSINALIPRKNDPHPGGQEMNYNNHWRKVDSLDGLLVLVYRQKRCVADAPFELMIYLLN
jgi:hypothetical protein